MPDIILKELKDEIASLKAQLASEKAGNAAWESEHLRQAAEMEKQLADAQKDAERWRWYARSAQTALQLGTKLDQNSKQDWLAECNMLADKQKESK